MGEPLAVAAGDFGSLADFVNAQGGKVRMAKYLPAIILLLSWLVAFVPDLVDSFNQGRAGKDLSEAFRQIDAARRSPEA